MPAEVDPLPAAVPLKVRQALAAREAQRRAFGAAHGDVKEVITAKLDEWRFVAVGNTLQYSKKWKVFHDFLGPYLGGCLGKEWGEQQVKLPLQQQQPIVQWHTIMGQRMQGSQPNANGLYATELGAANAWFRLAYDLYLIQHNAELQKRLIRRLVRQ